MTVLIGIILFLIVLTVLIGAAQIALALIFAIVIWLMWCAVVEKIRAWWANCD